jgi:periplasmic protein TonB
MNDRLAGIVLSGAIHAACLALLLFLPAAKGVPIRTFHIRFEPWEPFTTEAPEPVTSATRKKAALPKGRREAIPKAEEKRPGTPVARENKIDDEVRPSISVAPEPAAVSLPNPGPIALSSSAPEPTVVGAPNPGLMGGAVSRNTVSKTSGMPLNPGDASSQKGGDAYIVETMFGELDAPSFIHRATPVYPRVARRLEKEGRVVLKLLIDQSGNLRSVEVIEPASFGFTEAAVEAVRKSTFAPARRNGEGVLSWAVLPIRFRLE